MKKNKNNKKDGGFTLIEILIVIGLIAILAAVALVAINPGRQFAEARNTQRVSNVAAIANAVSQNASDNKGIFTCPAGVLPATAVDIKSDTGGYDIRGCLVPTYLAEIPLDPSVGTLTSTSVYQTGYQIQEDSVTKRITVLAPHAELGATITMVH